DEVRVMTVHGAKGLEAPIVVLADTTAPPAGPPGGQPRLLPAHGDDPDAGLAWLPAKAEATETTARAREAAAVAAGDEYRRLLYVAMTRAADRLVICGALGKKEAPAGCWYELIEQGLEASGR